MSTKADSSLARIRNVGTIAHIDAGKTTWTERALYETERIHRIGEVHEGTATMDYMPEEQERGITITSACTSCTWRDRRINIIDTPGHVDFTIEVERSLRVLDGAVGVFCAVNGVEPQSETVWRQSEQYHVPKLAFVNKMDRPGADFEAVLRDLRAKLGAKPLPLQIPEGEGDEFAGIVDLLRLRFLRYVPGLSRGECVEETELSPEQLERALRWREGLVETLAEGDEALLERYLAEETISEEELMRSLRERTLGLEGVPVLLGSALKNVGVRPVLDAICDYLPSPLEVPRIQGLDPASGQAVSFPVATDSPLSALVFKVTLEGGRLLALTRIYSGHISAGDRVYNAGKEVTQRVSRLFSLHAGRKERLDHAGAGEIVAAAGMKGAGTGDTLCSEEQPILLERIGQYRPVISLALEPRNAPEEEKLLQALDKLVLEDPTLFMERDQDTEQIILSGMGELHLEVVLERLSREFKVDYRAGRPQVVCRETVLEKATAEETFSRELGGVPHHGHVVAQVEPVGRDRENEVRFGMSTEGWHVEWLEEVEQALRDGLQSGVLQGAPVQGVMVRVLDMGQPREDSSGAGYHMAAAGALKKGLQAAHPVLMEPIMNLELFVPEDFVGDVVTLLGAKGAKVESMQESAEGKAIQSLAPLSKMFGFSTELRSATQGRATFSMRFDRFDVLE
ncbi:MAG: elongation factor G [Desulfohalobiaceae bacterium]